MCENIAEEIKCDDDDGFCFVFVFINDALERLIKEKVKVKRILDLLSSRICYIGRSGPVLQG